MTFINALFKGARREAASSGTFVGSIVAKEGGDEYAEI